MRIVLLGDSHLARVRRNLHQLTDAPHATAPGDTPSAAPARVVNAAVGGSDVLDLIAQANHVGIGADDRIAVSVGTNDAAPWKRVELAEGVARLDEFLASIHPERLVFLAPPGVDEARLGHQRPHDRTNQTMERYAASYAAAFTAKGATIVDTPAILAPLGASAFTDDGVHLNARAYAVVLPALRSALNG